MIRICALMALMSLPGCLSLGVTGSAQPTSNSEVVIGADVDETGAVKPRGKVIFDLF